MSCCTEILLRSQPGHWQRTDQSRMVQSIRFKDTVKLLTGCCLLLGAWLFVSNSAATFTITKQVPWRVMIESMDFNKPCSVQAVGSREDWNATHEQQLQHQQREHKHVDWHFSNKSEAGSITPANKPFSVDIQFASTVEELLLTYDTMSWYNIYERLSAVQSPERCDLAKFLLIDDISTTSGFGWQTVVLMPLALQSFVTGRVLVHASSVIQGVRWSWCLEPPYSPDCYFKAWTPCIAYLRSLDLTVHDLQAAQSWDNFTAYDTGVRFLAYTNMNMRDATTDRVTGELRDKQFWWAEGWFASAQARSSRFYWYGLMMQQYYSPNTALDTEAVNFLLASGLIYGERFIVAHVRHGNKSVEQALVPVEDYIAPMKQLLSCIKSRHVLLVTETSAAAQQMLELSEQHKINVFTVKYDYPDRDLWNPAFGSGTSTASMAEIARVSALVLAITRRGSGFIGSLQSAWAKISVAHMYGYHRRPVPAISLADGYTVQNGYIGDDKFHWTFNSSQILWPCLGST